MAKCMACGKTALLTTTFSNVILCKNCGSIANVSSWVSREFANTEALVEMKNDTLQKATTGNMSQVVVTEIAKYFDEYINAGYIAFLNGKAGQTLKVFRDYCVITTKNEGKKNELENLFYQFDDDDGDDDNFLTVDNAKQLVGGLMSGKLVQTGIGVAVSAGLNQYEKEKAIEKRDRERQKKADRLITVGERRIDLRNIASVEVYSRTSIANGYLRFVPKGVLGDILYDCEYFFFNNSLPFETKKIRQRVECIKGIILDRISAIGHGISVVEASPQCMTQDVAQTNRSDAFEEIRKYKQLLDEGIISEEEFNIKKKELLGL